MWVKTRAVSARGRRQVLALGVVTVGSAPPRVQVHDIAGQLIVGRVFDLVGEIRDARASLIDDLDLRSLTERHRRVPVQPPFPTSAGRRPAASRRGRSDP